MSGFLGRTLTFSFRYRIFTALIEMSEAQLESGAVPLGNIGPKPADFFLEICSLQLQFSFVSYIALIFGEYKTKIQQNQF